MATITNIKHFLDEDGKLPELPVEARKLVDFLSSIIESASGNYDLPVSFAQAECMRTTDNTSCPGDIEVWVYAEDNNIGWQCLECGDEGVISEWSGTIWDKRNYIKH